MYLNVYTLMLKINHIMKDGIKIVGLFFGTILLFYSCETDTLDNYENLESDSLDETNKINEENFILSDSLLLSILEDEKEILSQLKSGRIVNIEGMDVVKENPKKVYAHYMPWFQSREYDGYWGQHWTMTNRNPDLIDSDGKRTIASHYYPLIGPYSSADPDLQEYHFLLMKLSGIDGVIFDWYGSQDFYDYGLIKEATETFMYRLDDLDMDFSIMYEDRVAQHAVDLGFETDLIAAATNDFEYIKNTYLKKNNFLTHNDKNLLFVFGPEYLIQPEDWSSVFEVFQENESPNFLTLWAAQNRVGNNATGEFLWIAPDHLLAHEYYYATYLQNNLVTVGSSYPGFHDYYQEGGWGNPHPWNIPHDDGETFVETLNYTHHEAADFIQLATWNDFGEGTMIEPTDEYGFMYLQLLQEYTGVAYTAEDFKVAVDLYKARKSYAKNEEVQLYLDRSYYYMKRSNTRRASRILQAVNTYY